MSKDFEMIKVTGLWSNESKAAGRFMTGNLNSKVRIIILSNKNKKNEKSPTAFLYLAPIDEKSSSGDESGIPDFDIAALAKINEEMQELIDSPMSI